MQYPCRDRADERADQDGHGEGGAGVDCGVGLCLVSGRGGGCEAEQEHGRDDAVGETALGGQDLT